MEQGCGGGEGAGSGIGRCGSAGGLGNANK